MSGGFEEFVKLLRSKDYGAARACVSRGEGQPHSQSQLETVLDIFEFGDSGQHFKVLGIESTENPTKEVIKAAFRTKGLLVHPDKLKHEVATEAFQRLGECTNKVLQGEPSPDEPEQDHPAASEEDAFAWWSSWDREDARVEEPTSSLEAADLATLRRLSMEELAKETRKRQKSVLDSLGSGVGAEESRRKHKRARGELARRRCAQAHEEEHLPCGFFAE